MNYKSTFLANTKYTANDINAVIQQLVTGGVAGIQLVDGIEYNSSDLNRIMQYLTETNNGVNPENQSTLKVVKEGVSSIKIYTGTAIFASGASITVTDFVIMPFTVGVKNYVCVKHDVTLNTIEPYCTIEEPTGDYVPLAEVSEAGVVTDKRVYLKGKVAGYQSNFDRSQKVTITMNGKGSILLTALNGRIYNNFLFMEPGSLYPIGVCFNGEYTQYSSPPRAYFWWRGQDGSTIGTIAVRKVLNGETQEVWIDHYMWESHNNGVQTIDIYAF